MGSRVVVAVVGSFVADVEVVAQERAGVLSHGLLCDSAMLGWPDGESGSAVFLPKAFSPGDLAPTERPRRGEANVEDPRDPNAGAENLFGTVLTKEQKKEAAAKKKAEREAKKRAAAGGGLDEGAADDGAPKPRLKPSKAELKKCKKLAAEKRKAGGEAFTDDELEAAGFLLEGEEP